MVWILWISEIMHKAYNASALAMQSSLQLTKKSCNLFMFDPTMNTSYAFYAWQWFFTLSVGL